jgi:hypothetical protein
MAQALDMDAIANLLGPKKKVATAKQPTKPRGTVWFGPLRYVDAGKPCMSRNCGTYTHTTVNSVYLCTRHAQEELNRIIMEMTLPHNFSLCDCKSGHYSRFNVHNPECAMLRGEEVTSGVSSDG